MRSLQPLIDTSGRVFAASGAAIVALALMVAGVGAGPFVRSQLGLSFGAPPWRAERVLDVGANNLRLAATALVGAVAVQCLPRLRTPIDLVLGALAATNIAAVGLAVGAYGAPLLAALALHGVLELAAFAMCAGAYLAARRRNLTLGVLAAVGGLVVTLLAAAASVETYLERGMLW